MAQNEEEAKPVPKSLVGSLKLLYVFRCLFRCLFPRRPHSDLLHSLTITDGTSNISFQSFSRLLFVTTLQLTTKPGHSEPHFSSPLLCTPLRFNGRIEEHAEMRI